MLPWSKVRVTSVRTTCQPCTPAAPGLTTRHPRERSGITLRMWLWPHTNSLGRDNSSRCLLKGFHLLEASAQRCPVHIAAHRAEHGCNGFQLVGQLIAADVACMPHLVTVGEMLRVAVVPPGVSVTDDAYLLHILLSTLKPLKPLRALSPLKHYSANSISLARYLPMMSNSRFTTVPTSMQWKLVISRV